MVHICELVVSKWLDGPNLVVPFRHRELMRYEFTEDVFRRSLYDEENPGYARPHDHLCGA